MSGPTAQTSAQRRAELISDIGTIRSQIEDTLHMGDAMFGEYAHVKVAEEVTARKEELKKKKEALEEEIRRKEAIIQRTNRDFTDVKDAIPESEEPHVRFIEDYTLLFLSLAYVFMVLSAVVYHVALSPMPWQTLGRSLGYSVLGTAFAGIILYAIA